MTTKYQHFSSPTAGNFSFAAGRRARTLGRIIGNVAVEFTALFGIVITYTFLALWLTSK